MTLQHYLPATYLAFFSLDDNPVRRDRVMSVGFVSNGKIIDVKASHICKERNIYEMSFENKKMTIDNNWSYYENEMAFAIDQLAARNISALAWANVLVPFVTSLFIRGPDFESRFTDRLSGLEEMMNFNVARMFELQRLLPIIATAKWVVHTTTKEPPLVTNELGYTISKVGPNLETGISIPFAKNNLIISILPKVRRWIIRSSKNEWKPIIEYSSDYGFIGNSKTFNISIANYAQKYVIGEASTLVHDCLQERKIDFPLLEPAQLGFPIQHGRNHEMTWKRLIHFLQKESPKNYCAGYIDLSSVPKGPFMIINPTLSGPESDFHL